MNLAILIGLLVFSELVNAGSSGGSVLTFEDLGKFRIGMTRAQVKRVDATTDWHVESNRMECEQISPKGNSKVRLMFEDGRLSRIDVADPRIATWRGARVGMLESQLRRQYAGRLRTEPHKYVDDGRYLKLTSANGKLAMIFESDGKRVTTFRAGLAQSVGYVEGCS